MIKIKLLKHGGMSCL